VRAAVRRTPRKEDWPDRDEVRLLLDDHVGQAGGEVTAHALVLEGRRETVGELAGVQRAARRRQGETAEEQKNPADRHRGDRPTVAHVRDSPAGNRKKGIGPSSNCLRLLQVLRRR
jgi:hypothetical protein